MTDVVTLQLPHDRDCLGVAHLVLGGLAARLDLTYDVLEDMTTAIDELLECRESTDDVVLAVEIEDGALVATVGPFTNRVVEDLQPSDEGLSLRRVLDASVDHVELSERDGSQWVELTKSLGSGN
jgi:anti-sigma regulatory factor (Ser/Thr protein kinase)